MTTEQAIINHLEALATLCKAKVEVYLEQGKTSEAAMWERRADLLAQLEGEF